MINILFNPLTKILIGLLISIVLFSSSFYKGKSIATKECQEQIAIERLKWQSKIDTLQKQYDSDKRNIKQYYTTELDKSKAIISQLDASLKSTKKKLPTQYIPKEVNNTIPKGFVELHNKAVENQYPSMEIIQPEKMTNITLSEVSKVITRNYYACNLNTTKLIALQSIVQSYQSYQTTATE